MVKSLDLQFEGTGSNPYTTTVVFTDFQKIFSEVDSSRLDVLFDINIGDKNFYIKIIKKIFVTTFDDFGVKRFV